MTGSDGSLGALGPAELTAIMRNSYSCPFAKSGTVA